MKHIVYIYHQYDVTKTQEDQSVGLYRGTEVVTESL